MSQLASDYSPESDTIIASSFFKVQIDATSGTNTSGPGIYPSLGNIFITKYVVRSSISFVGVDWRDLGRSEQLGFQNAIVEGDVIRWSEVCYHSPCTCLQVLMQVRQSLEGF